jgi:hypothetical protein
MLTEYKACPKCSGLITNDSVFFTHPDYYPVQCKGCDIAQAYDEYYEREDN